MDWAIYLSQLVNPFVGSTGAIPLAVGVLKLPAAGVAAFVVPANVLQIAVLHLLWQALLRRPRIAAWIEARRSPRVQAWLQSRGAFIAAVAATFVLGSIPAYVSLRYLGVPLGRFWSGAVLGCAVFGAIVTGACKVTGM